MNKGIGNYGKKTITKEQILTAAYEVVATEGFSKFTARNIANKMKCSTNRFIWNLKTWMIYAMLYSKNS